MTQPIEQVFPVGIPAGTVVKLAPGIDSPAEVELIVAEGGPIYAWIGGQKDAASAALATNPDSNADFDLASTATESRKLNVTGGVSRLTLFAKVDTIGYVKFTECS